MSLFRRERRSVISDATYNPFDNPGISLASLIHASGSFQGVQPEQGMAVPAAYRCVSIIASTIAAAPLEILNPKGEADCWGPWQGLVSYTSFEITELIVTHLAGWGNFFADKVLQNGRLVDLQPIHPSRVTVRLLRGQKTFLITPDPLNESSDAPLRVVTEADGEILHIPFLGHDGLKGVSPIMWAGTTFSSALAADALSNRFHTNGQHIQGIVKIPTPLASQDDAEGIKRHWQEANAGIYGAGSVAVLDSGADFTPLTLDPDALQLLESRTWSMQEIGRVYGVPLTMLSTASTGYGDAIATQMEGFVTLTLRSYTDRIEQRLAREFTPRGSCLAFNLDHILRGNPNERYSTYNIAIAGGWMTRAEVRELEGLPEIDGLNEPLEPSTMNGQIQTPPLSVPGAEPAALPPGAPSPTADEPSATEDGSPNDD